MQTTVSRFTGRVVSLAKKATGDRSEPAVQRVEGGFADWVFVTIHALREFKSSWYRALLDELSQIGAVVEKMDLDPGELPDFTTVCTISGPQNGRVAGPDPPFGRSPPTWRSPCDRRNRVRSTGSEPTLRASNELSVQGRENDRTR